MGKRQDFVQRFHQQLREHQNTFVLYVVLRALVILVMIFQFINGNYENVFLCILTLCLLVVPSLIQANFSIELPSVLEIIILLFIFGAEILGEIQAYYILFPFWDVMLHTLNGFLAAAIGFCLVDLLNRDQNISFELSPLFLAIVAFCFAMTIGVIWEFFECAMDLIWGLDMQKDTVIHRISSVHIHRGQGNRPVVIEPIESVSINGQELGLGGYLDIGLLDTMKDLFVNFIGAFCFSVIGYFYIKSRGKHPFISRLIPKVNRKGN